MKIGDIAKRTGLTVHTLRYYERIGLLPFAPRDSTGQRMYDVSILAWIDFLARLKTTGMPIQGMLRYAELRSHGAATEEERRALLAEHRDKVRIRVAELQASVLVLDAKIAGYANAPLRTEDAKRNQTPGGSGKPVKPRQANPV